MAHARRPSPVRSCRSGRMPALVTTPVTHNTEVSVIRGILAFIVVFLLATFPATWLLMLFFGNVGLEQLSYWGTLPLGILVSVLLGGVTAPKYATY
jgi:hypothetical protein